MGTETYHSKNTHHGMQINLVKLNNPLMGTETK